MRAIDLFDALHPGASWRPWRAFVAAVYGEPLDDAGLALFRACTGRQAPREGGYAEACCIVGVQSGKSRVTATLATHAALTGERGTHALIVGQDHRGAMRALLRYCRDAQDRFRLVYEELQAELTSPEAKASSAYEAHLAKFPRLVAGLSLILQLADEPTAGVVGLDALDRAIRWCALLGAHARKVYGSLIRPDVAAALNLGAKLRAQAVEDGTAVREVYRAGWAGLREPEAVEAALGVLAEHGWLTVQEVGRGAGRRRRIIRVNPAAVQGGEA